MSWKITVFCFVLMRNDHLIEASCPKIEEHLRDNEKPQITLEDFVLSWGTYLQLEFISVGCTAAI